MIIALFRHGHAESYANSDAERALSEAGIYQARSAAKQLAGRIAQFDHVWVSPFKRAQQTWQQASEFIGGAVTEQPLITPSGDVDTVIGALSNLPNDAKVLLVTHQMFVGDLLDALGGFERGKYLMGTANIAVLNTDIAARGLAHMDAFILPK